MMSKSGFTIDTSNFNQMIKDLSRLSGLNMEEVLKAEINGPWACAANDACKAKALPAVTPPLEPPRFTSEIPTT